MITATVRFTIAQHAHEVQAQRLRQTPMLFANLLVAGLAEVLISFEFLPRGEQCNRPS